jgi:Ni,Fe-hydrogenase III large subunit
MMDVVIPGGLAADLAPGGAEAILRALAALTAELPEWLAIHDEEASLAERMTGLGRVPPALARDFAAGGCIGRAAGRAADLRRHPGYPPYDTLNFEVPVLPEGDIAARARLRLAELRQSAALAAGLLRALPEGAVSVPLPPVSGEGFGWAEGGRGDVWHWLCLDGGMIAACFPRDPAWLHWPLLEIAACDGTLADLPLCVASFGCGVSGVDL